MNSAVHKKVAVEPIHEHATNSLTSVKKRKLSSLIAKVIKTRESHENFQNLGLLHQISKTSAQCFSKKKPNVIRNIKVARPRSVSCMVCKDGNDYIQP